MWLQLCRILKRQWLFYMCPCAEQKTRYSMDYWIYIYNLVRVGAAPARLLECNHVRHMTGVQCIASSVCSLPFFQLGSKAMPHIGERRGVKKGGEGIGHKGRADDSECSNVPIMALSMQL